MVVVPFYSQVLRNSYYTPAPLSFRSVQIPHGVVKETLGTASVYYSTTTQSEVVPLLNFVLCEYYTLV